MGRAVWRSMGSGVIFGEDAGAVVGGKDEDGIDGEEGHIGRHHSGGARVEEERIPRAIFPAAEDYGRGLVALIEYCIFW